MQKHFQIVAVAVLVLFLLPGCEEGEPPPPPDQAVPAPPTAAEIQQEIWKQVQPIEQNFHQGLPFSMGQLEPSLKALQTTLAGHRASLNGPDAFRNVASQLKDLVRQADRQGKPWYVVYFFDSLKMVDAPSTADVVRLREQAQLIIDRPKPTITGFWTDEATGQVTVFLRVFVPTTGQTFSEKVREGDEFHNLRLVEIIGANKGVKFEYLVTNDEFEVFTDAARQSM